MGNLILGGVIILAMFNGSVAFARTPPLARLNLRCTFGMERKSVDVFVPTSPLAPESPEPFSALLFSDAPRFIGVNTAPNQNGGPPFYVTLTIGDQRKSFDFNYDEISDRRLSRSMVLIENGNEIACHLRFKRFARHFVRR